MDKELRPIWRRLFDFNWKFGLFLILIICIPRFILVMIANQTANYGYIGLMMLISALAPFIFLTRQGRKEIGLVKPKPFSLLFIAFILGLIFSVLLYFIGEILYDDSYKNWYVYIGRSYNIPGEINPDDKLILFAIMAGTGMIFSPVGEELFFRGIVHGSFEKSWGSGTASVIDSTAFALTHISHFGLVFIGNEWKFLFVPTLIWIAAMFLASVLFYQCRKKSGSLAGAILCHAAFNLGMIYCIFYWLH